MQKLTLTSDLPFIFQKGIKDCYLEPGKDGIVQLKAGNYIQILKASEVKKVLENAGVSSPEAEAPSNDGNDGEITVGATVAWSGKKGRATGEVLELVAKNTKARIRSDADDKVYIVEVKALTIFE